MELQDNIIIKLFNYQIIKLLIENQTNDKIIEIILRKILWQKLYY